MKATKDHLKVASLAHGTVTVDGLEYEIRPLSRREQIDVQEARERDGLAMADALLISKGLVDPKLTLGEVMEWQDTPGQGEAAAAVSEGIGRISGLMRDSGKEAYKSAR